MEQFSKQNASHWRRRLTSGFLAFAMSLSFLPSVAWAQEEDSLTLAEEFTVGTSLDGETTVEVGTLGETIPTEGETPAEPEEPIGHWSDPYVSKMIEYGYLRTQDAVDPDAPMTRAEFVSIINRAYNYTEKSGNMTFTDVSEHDWFHDDIDIATTAGYISGTSETTVEPFGTLSRETTAFILGKNLMLPTVFGEDMNFTDTREISSWSRALVKATSEYGLMAGYSDGSFRPLNSITIGEISTLVMKAIGTPILEGGETSLGEVYGNVTITEPGTVLKNTVIVGDLHISNGIGLGSVVLENVTVLGRIVVSGGESEGGDASVLLRNVVAEELVIDNMDDQYVSVRVDGTTVIENTYVRTNAYVEDTTVTSEGLINIVMDADPGITLDLAGRVKTVTNTSPGTVIRVVDGTVDELNIDESATEAVTEVMMGGEIIQLNIDVATNVVGDGDVQNVTVNANDVVIEMLPDNIEIRPGVDANIFGEDMNNLTAQEYSAKPMILSGYPQASNVAPTSMDAIFSTNKTGTVYWAVSNITQGSVMESDLIKPPAYGHIALTYGSINITEAEEEFIALIDELPVGGSYYLSAVLVDARGDISPVKVIAFSTPDNSIPAFGEGYPYMSKVDNTSAQVTVMATKDCKLYYAVLPIGAIAPTSADFLANAVSGNLGFGTQTLTKNKSESYTVSDILDEVTEYDLYLWLTDADGMNYSEVVVLTFKTTDGTAPSFNQEVQTTTIGVTDVDFAFNINEDGTLYWAVVDTGTYYPSVKPGDTTGNLAEPLTSEYAAYSVMWGIGALFAGSVEATANTSMTFNLAGLSEESSYDMYYIARDAAGNFSLPVRVLTFNTIDNTPPVFVEQLFSHSANADDEDGLLPQPYASTSVTLVFSEGIQATNSGQSFLQLYKNVVNADGEVNLVAAKKVLGDTLAYCFPFYTWNGNSPTAAVIRDGDYNESVDGEWLIDYRNTEITSLDGKMYVKFPTYTDDINQSSGLNLSAGVTYGFKIQNIRDSSSDANIMSPAELVAGQNSLGLEQFTTVYAQILLGTADVMVGDLPYARDVNGEPTNTYAQVDGDLQVTPSDMGNVDESVLWEMRMNPDAFVSYNLYMRVVNARGDYTEDLQQYYPETPSVSYFTDGDNKVIDVTDTTVTGDVTRKEKVVNNWEPDDNGWVFLRIADVMPQQQTTDFRIEGNSSGMGVGLINQFWGYQNDTMPYPFLYELSDEYQYEFVFEVTRYGSSTTRGEWNGFLNIDVQIWAGNYNTVKSIGSHGSPSAATYNTLSLVSSPENYATQIVFTDSIPPEFNTGAPQVTPSDISAKLDVALNRNGEVNYVVVKSTAPNNFGPEFQDGTTVPDEDIPDINSALHNNTLSEWPIGGFPLLGSPDASEILGQVTVPGSGVISGVVNTGINTVTIDLVDLEPLTEYYVYFIMKSDSGGGYSQVYMAKFTTLDTEKPKYDDLFSSPDTGNVTWTTHVSSNLNYLMLTTATVSNSLPWVNLSFYDYLKQKPNELSTVPKDGGGYYTFVEIYEMSPYYLDNDITATSSEDHFTILDLLTSVYSTSGNYEHPDYTNGYTGFDIFASDTLKSDMYAAIIASYSPTIAQANASPSANDTTEAVRNPLTGNDPDYQYILFITGYNVNADTSKPVAERNSFRALANFSVTDLNGPKLNSVATSGSQYNGTTDAYSGFVSIEFDKFIYASSGSTTYFIQQKIEDPTIDPWSDASRRKMLEITGNAGLVQYRTTHTSANISAVTSSLDKNDIAKGFTFEYSNIKNGDTIVLFNSSYFISNKDGNPHDQTSSTSNKTLTLTFHTEKVVVEEITNADGSVTTYTQEKVWWDTNWDEIDNITPTTQTDGSFNPKDTVTGTPDPTTPTTPAAASVSIEADTGAATTTMMMGETLGLEAIVEGSNSTVTWGGTSSTTLKGTSNKNQNTVTAMKPGNYTVTAKVDGETATYSVTVVAPTVTVTNNDPDLVAGAIGTMKVVITNIADPKALTGTWSVSTTGNSKAQISLSNDVQGFGTKTLNSTSYTDLGDNTWETTVYFKGAVACSGSVSYAMSTAKDTKSFSIDVSGSTNN